MTARTWTLDIARPDEWVTANHREHFMVRAAKTKAWRDAAAVHARAAGIPALDKVRITAQECPSGNRRRDVDRVALTVKACIDGIVDAGVIPDDNTAHLLELTYAV